MALRHHDIVRDVENRLNRGAKSTKIHTSQPTRPALDELSNKLSVVGPTKPLLKRTEAAKPLKIENEIKPQTKAQEVKSYSSKQLETVFEEDRASSNDPQMVTDYISDIFQYLKEYELKFPIRKHYLEGHKTTRRMREILINWLVQVQQNFGACLETLHMCVSLIDRYLQNNLTVGRSNLQLVGTAALFIAYKYEEMYVPEISDFEFICDNTYKKNQILKMEKNILLSLDFNLGKPLSIHFLRRYSKIARVQMQHHDLSKYLLELALLEHDMCHIRPSIQAAAACCLSLSILNNASSPLQVWTEKLTRSIGYGYSDLKQVVEKLASLLLVADTSKNKSVYNKYAESKFSKISTNSKLKGSLVRKLAESSSKV